MNFNESRKIKQCDIILMKILHLIKIGVKISEILFATD